MGGVWAATATHAAIATSPAIQILIAAGRDRRMTAYRVEVRVMPRAALLDPQGQAVEHALHALGFKDVAKVRVGKHVVLDLDAPSSEAAAEQGAPWGEFAILADALAKGHDLERISLMKMIAMSTVMALAGAA